jgi:hypothetical protein
VVPGCWHHAHVHTHSHVCACTREHTRGLHRPAQSRPLLALAPLCQVARQANKELLALPEAPGVDGAADEVDTQAILQTVSAELGSEAEATRLEALHWVNVLLQRDRPQVCLRAVLPVPQRSRQALSG